MLNVAIENQNGWNYSCSVPQKTGTGISTLLTTIAHNRASAVFLRAKHSLIRIMVGRAGQPKGWPVPMVAGSANPVRLTTHEISTSRGEFTKLTVEDAIMATIPALSHPEVTIENGRAVTTSVAVAEYFRKRHDNVLRAIANIECSPEFSALNFEDAEYTDEQGKKRPAYQITKNGFVFLVMGFTGKKAAAFKEAYIAEFDRMESELRQQSPRQVSNDLIHGDGRTLVIRLDAQGNILHTCEVPVGACVGSIESFRFFMEQEGWIVINRNKIKNMTLEQLLSLK